MKFLFVLPILLLSAPGYAGVSTLSSRLAAAVGAVAEPITVPSRTPVCALRVNRLAPGSANDIGLVDVDLVNEAGQVLASFRGFDEQKGNWDDRISDTGVHAHRRFASMLTGRMAVQSIDIEHMPLAGLHGATILITEDGKTVSCDF